MNRIERNGYTYPAWSDSDERVIELFRSADRKRKMLWKKLAVWSFAAMFCVGAWWVIIYGAARAIDLAKGY
jgi:hypothetical protein